MLALPCPNQTQYVLLLHIGCAGTYNRDWTEQIFPPTVQTSGNRHHGCRKSADRMHDNTPIKCMTNRCRYSLWMLVSPHLYRVPSISLTAIQQLWHTSFVDNVSPLWSHSPSDQGHHTQQHHDTSNHTSSHASEVTYQQLLSIPCCVLNSYPVCCVSSASSSSTSNCQKH